MMSWRTEDHGWRTDRGLASVLKVCAMGSIMARADGSLLQQSEIPRPESGHA